MGTGKHFRGASLKSWVLLPVLGLSLWAQERPLPEVAREKPGKTATRVFTNEDLEGKHSEATSSPSAAAGSGSAQNDKEPTARVAVPGLLDQATMSEARVMLKSLQRDEEVLLRRYAQIEERLARESDEHLRRLYSDSLARREQTVARKREQILQVKKAIEAAESSRASAPGSK